jgi:hypothetical protein
MSRAVFDKSLDQALREVMQPTFVRGIVHLLLALYVVRLAPNMPKSISDVFDNQYVKLFVFALVLWTAQFSPSTAIMISLAFMVSVNYAMNKPLWEFMENEADHEKEEAVDAVQTLAVAAVSPESLSEEEVQKAVEIAASAVATQEGADALAHLAQQAMSPEPTPVEQVSSEVQDTLAGMPAVTEVPPMMAIVPAQEQAPAAPVSELLPAPEAPAVEAVKELAMAAAAPEPAPVAEVKAAAETAMAAVATQSGAEAISQLAEQALAPEPTPEPMVVKEAVVAMAAIPAVSQEQAKAEVAGCFPPRRFDLSNVVGYEPSLFELSA